MKNNRREQNPKGLEYARHMQELRRSNATAPRINKKKYSRKEKYRGSFDS